VLCPCASKGKQIAAVFQYPQALLPDFNARYVIIPLLAHKGQTVRRIGNNGIYAVIWKGLEYFQAIAVVNHDLITPIEQPPPPALRYGDKAVFCKRV
jgi:hypothetical protein